MNENKSKIIIGIVVLLIIVFLLCFKKDTKYITMDSQTANTSNEIEIESGGPPAENEYDYKYYKLTIKNLKNLSEDSKNSIDIDELYTKTKEYIIKNNVFGCNELTYEKIEKKGNGNYLIYLVGDNRTIEVLKDNNGNYEFELVTE